MPPKQQKVIEVDLEWYSKYYPKIRELAGRPEDRFFLLDHESRAQTFLKQLLEEGCEENRARYMSLFERLSKAKGAEKASLESELLSFFYFTIFLDLRQQNLPWASYYCDLAYDVDPTKSLRDYPAYEYTRNLEAKPPLFNKAPEIYDRYREIARVGPSPQRELAKIKCFLLEVESLEGAFKALEKFQENHQELDRVIEAEKSWIAVADFAKGFKSANPSFQDLFKYIAQSTSKDYPNLQKIPKKNLREPSGEDIRHLQELLFKARKSQAFVPMAERVNKDKTARACAILYSDRPQVRVKYWLETVRNNDPETLYSLAENYELLSSWQVFETMPDEEARADYQKLILNVRDNFLKPQDERMVALPNERMAIRSAEMHFLECAAWTGHPAAQYAIATKYLIGSTKGKSEQSRCQSREKYLHFLLLAAKNNVIQAQYDYAELISSGQIQSTLETKITYYQQAARQGHSGAEQRLVEIERSFLELDILQISDAEFKDLKSASNIMGDSVIPLKLLACLEKGPKKFRDPALAREVREKLAQHSPEDRFKLARVMLEIEASSQKLIEEKNAAPFVELLAIESLHEKILAVLANKENSITLRYILACTIHDYFEASKISERSALERINANALLVISEAADSEINHAKIKLANLMIKNASEGWKRNALTSLAAGVINEKEISPKTVTEAIKKIGELLETHGVLNPSLSVEFYTNFCAIAEMGDEIKFKLSLRIAELAIEVARYGRVDDEKLLQKESAKLVVASSNTHDPAKIALISLFYEGECVVDIEQIKKFRKWGVANINATTMAAHLYKIGHSADAEMARLLQVEFTHYCKLSSEKEELKARCPNWAAIIDDMLKAEADALEKARKEEAGAKAAKAAVTAKNPREQQAERARQAKEEQERKKREEVEARKREEAEKKQKLAEARAADLLKKAEEQKYEALRTEGGRGLEDDVAKLEQDPLDEKLKALEEARLKAEEVAKLKQQAELDEKLKALEEGKLKAEEVKLAKLQARQEKLEKEKAEERSRQVGQMQEFLSKSPTINSVADLPEFLRKPFTELLKKGHEIFVKGSAVYQNPHKKGRQPKDLDIEVFFADISKLSEDEIKAFIQQSFGIRVEDIKIIKGKDSTQGEYFTVRAEDKERRIDLAVYDKKILPVSKLSWATSVEKKVIFGADGTATLSHPRGFEEYISNLEKSEDPQKKKLARLFHLDEKRNLKPDSLTRTESIEFASLAREFGAPPKEGALTMINPFARNLFLRVAFLMVIGQIEEKELDFMLGAAGVAKKPAFLNPTSLLRCELKVDTLTGQVPQKIEEQVKIAINSFIENHSLAEGNLQSEFLSALLKIADKGVSYDGILNAENAIILGAIRKMEEECRGVELPLAQAAASCERESPSAQEVFSPSNSRLRGLLSGLDGSSKS